MCCVCKMSLAGPGCLRIRGLAFLVALCMQLVSNTKVNHCLVNLQLSYTHHYKLFSAHVILASHPGHVGGGLVSTGCACANDSGNLLRTSPLWTSYTWLLSGCVYAAMAFIIRDTRDDMARTMLQPPPIPPWRHFACSWQSRSRWTFQIPWVPTGIRLYHHRCI